MKVRDECECAFYFLCKIHPEEDDYGFQIEEKNKAIVVKSVTRGSHAEVMASKLTNKHTHTVSPSCPRELLPLGNGCLLF